jgi:hypothetical protein
MLETRLSEAVGHLQLACKDVKWSIIGFRACERTDLSTVKGSQRPWMWSFFTLFLIKNIFWLVIRHVALKINYRGTLKKVLCRRKFVIRGVVFPRFTKILPKISFRSLPVVEPVTKKTMNLSKIFLLQQNPRMSLFHRLSIKSK